MNDLTLSCPKATYDREMRITCGDGGLCGHQRYLRCKGWSILTDQAGRCPLRKDEGNGEGHETAAHGGD